MRKKDESGQSEARQAQAREAEAAPAGKQRVLVVDDYDDAREMYTEYLQYAGFEVDQARNGLEAIERAQESRPDVIIMDMSLPLVSGWEATRRLKEDERTRAIPVMALTGHALPGHAREAQEVGCDAYVTKPCLPADLTTQIRTMLQKTKTKVGRTRRGSG